MNNNDIFAMRYRPCVGIMLLNKAQQAFIGKRRDVKGNAWQMPQGGIDPHETVVEAALRELQEEIGTDNVSLLAVSQQVLRYDFPRAVKGKVWGGCYRGQAQRWVLMQFQGRDEDINLFTEHPEFIEWRWENLPEVERLAVPFKKEIYAAVIKEFLPYIQKRGKILRADS